MEFEPGTLVRIKKHIDSDKYKTCIYKVIKHDINSYIVTIARLERRELFLVLDKLKDDVDLREYRELLMDVIHSELYEVKLWQWHEKEQYEIPEYMLIKV